jgi:geranyl-CoA carboxylase alpha subunit
VRSTINGRVVEVVIEAGADVLPGERLVVLEAMKMEHEVRATRAGRILEVGVRAGEQVVPGQVLARYEGALR